MSQACQERVIDVVTWHGIDLDYVLDQHCESENEFDAAVSAVSFPPSESSSDDENPGNQNKPASGKPDVRGVLYKCPLCEKSLRNSSGFRGHVLNQHHRADLRGKFKTERLSFHCSDIL